MSDVFFAPHSESKKRGRPSEISDATLLHCCWKFLGLEYQWSEIGWSLQRAKTLPDIRASLQPLKEPWRQDFELFLWEQTRHATTEEARALRARIKGLEKLARNALLEMQKAKERLDRAIQIAAEHSQDERIQKPV